MPQVSCDKVVRSGRLRTLQKFIVFGIRGGEDTKGWHKDRCGLPHGGKGYGKMGGLNGKLFTRQDFAVFAQNLATQAKLQMTA